MWWKTCSIYCTQPPHCAEQYELTDICLSILLTCADTEFLSNFLRNLIVHWRERLYLVQRYLHTLINCLWIFRFKRNGTSGVKEEVFVYIFNSSRGWQVFSCSRSTYWYRSPCVPWTCVCVLEQAKSLYIQSWMTVGHALMWCIFTDIILQLLWNVV